MNNTKDTRFLMHLDNSIPKNANNYMLSTYSIILEAWRRGLSIDIRIKKEASGKIEPYYSISSDKKNHNFSMTRGDSVSTEAKKLTKNKKTTKKYLQKNGVSTPDGRDFDKSFNNDDIIQYASEIGYPVVVKPLEGTGGTGVIANIKNGDELKEALHYVRKQLNSPHIILEKYFDGEDYRLYVIDGKVIAVIKRVRANVIGNGQDSIKQLVDKKNKKRSELPSLTDRPIKINKETKTLLKRKNLDLNSVIPKDELVELKSKNNVSAGGDSIDITDEVSDNIKKIAIAATDSFPSLTHCGLDMIVDEENDTGAVIELNSRAHITQHLYPMKGQARDIPSAIVDYYFPETKDHNREEANKLYVDYDFIFDANLSRNAMSVKIPKISPSPIELKRYTISSCKYTDQLAKRIRKIAFNNQINGYIKPTNNSSIVIAVGGRNKNINAFTKQLKRYVLRVSKNAKIEEKSRTTPVAHGFTIFDGNHSQNQNDVTTNYIEKYSSLKNDYQNLVRKIAEYEQKENVMELTKKQNKQLRKQVEKMEKSSSWQITKPIRFIGGKIKK